MIDIRDAAGHLLMRYNPDNNTAEIQRRGIKTIIDLNQYKESDMSADGDLQRIKDVVYQYCLNDSEKRAIVLASDLTVNDCVRLIANMAEQMKVTNMLVSQAALWAARVDSHTQKDTSAMSATITGGDHGHGSNG